MDVKNEAVVQLNELLSKDELDTELLNKTLDKLIIDLHYKQSSFSDRKLIPHVVATCCQRIPCENALLVAKTCNFIFNVVSKQKINLDNGTLSAVVPWLGDSIRNFADIAYLDLLQVIDTIVKNHPDYFSTPHSCDGLLNALFLNLEDKTKVTDPIEIKLTRLTILKSFIQYLPKNKQNDIAKSVLDAVYSLETDKPEIQAKIWTSAIEFFGLLCTKYQDWLGSYLEEVIGFIVAASDIGFDSAISAPPKPSLPSSVIVPPQIHPTSGEIKAKAKVTVQVKKPSKVKQIKWTNQKEESDEEESRVNADAYSIRWNQSESDQSDTEGGQNFRTLKLQARTRHEAFNLLIQIIKVVGSRPLYGFYALLMGKLVGNLRRDQVYKTKITALAAITALLSSSKNFLAQAQHREGGSFTTFSESLAQLIANLHTILGQLIKTSISVMIPPLLHTAAALISVTPYKRLKPSLLTNLFRVIHPFINNKDPSIISGALLCITEIVVLNPTLNEQQDILKSGIFSDGPSWAFSLSVDIIKNPVSAESAKLQAWHLMSGLCQCHYDLVKNHLKTLETFIVKDLEKIEENKYQHYVAKTLDYLLIKLLNDADMLEYKRNLWMTLMNGPFIPLAQSSSKMAAIACDCLSSLGPQIYHTLPEDMQILVITLTIGCCYNELSSVRAAAINTLGMFLLFPQIISEQFVHDTKDILVNALKDNNELVRSRAAWAFGNLIELIKEKNPDLLQEMSLFKLFEAGSSVFSDEQKVKANILRGLANLTLLVTEPDLKNNDLKTIIIKSANFFVHCATTGKLMKMRWNACYAIGTMLTNELLYSISNDWLGTIIQNLCTVLVKCSNFKVRINASHALISIKNRHHFTPYYHFVITSLLDGLDNAANMNDFKEFKHQDDLKQKLCIGICHMISLAEEEDVEELSQSLNYRFESLKTNLEYFINCAPPEKTSVVISASNNISKLKSASSSKNSFLNRLQRTFEIVSPQEAF